MIHLKLRLVRYVPMRTLRNALMALIFVISGTSATHAETVTIAALGDSLTAGYGLAPEEGFVPQLEAWLRAQGDEVRLVNAGVSGDTTAGGLSRLDWTLTPDVQALIVTLGGNDMLRGLPPTESRANLEAIVKGASERGLPVLIIGMSAPNNYGPDYKAEFDAIYPGLAAQYQTLLIPSFFAPLMAQSDDPAKLQALMQADGIHPSAAAVKIIVEGIGPAVRDLVGLVNASGG
jgi:acyl-CoA thioesterase-1